MQQVSLDEAKLRLLELIEAAHRGESVAITTEDARAVQLVPVVCEKRPRQFGSAKGLIVIADDFDEPLEDFHEYME